MRFTLSISTVALLTIAAAGSSYAAEPVHLFTEKGVPAGWVIGAVKDISTQPTTDSKWFVNDQGILTGTNTYDTWLMSKEEYGDFEIDLECKISPLGNSGVALRSPMHGHPSYEGMEVQILDPRYYEGRGAPEQLCGAIYRAIPPIKRMFKPEDWNHFHITCIGPHVKVVLNGEVVQDFNLDEQTKQLHRDKPEETATPLKERPRKGHIGFQDLCRDGKPAQFRNVVLHMLDGEVNAQHTDVQRIDFGNKDALAKWTISGDVGVDAAMGDAAHSNPLRVGPGGEARLKLHKSEASGTVEMLVFDDAHLPADPKAAHVGPRWGLIRDDGRVLAIGVLYNSYIGGAEGNTAVVCDGKDWFDQLFWLGGNRAKPAWHKWTFDLGEDGVIRLFRDDKPVGGEIEAGKVKMKGFNGIAIWGDVGKENGQTIWVSSPSIAVGGPVKVAEVIKADPYDLKIAANAPAAGWKGVIYTKANALAAPKLEELPLKSSISQYGITWTFDKPARVGQFVNGDWYVVGPATVTEIDPKPLYGSDIPNSQLDYMDKERPEAKRVRNGFMLNPPAAMKVAYDSGVKNWFDPSLVQKLPVSMKAGDSLVSTISMPKNLALKSQLWHDIERGVDDSSPIRTAAVLTCVSQPLPLDAFRPAFCDRQAKIFFSHDLKREMLPNLAPTKDAPDVRQYVRFTQRPWVGTCFFGFEGPVENMPQYGRDYGRVVGLDALMLCTDLKPEQKEELLIDYVQVGIDLGGMITNGHPGWEGFGGHGCGHKLPIVFAGLLLGDKQLANINKSFPKAHFGEDEQTAYGEGWTGAKVVFTGHRAIDEATGIARPATGPYEHKQPETWTGATGGGDLMSEGYRHTATFGFVAQGLALRLIKGEKAWNHDAFLDYVDRWMYEDDTPFVKTIKEKTGHDFSADWERQGQCFDPFVTEMWRKYRAAPGMAATDGWKQVHDESYYKNAIEKGRK